MCFVSPPKKQKGYFMGKDNDLFLEEKVLIHLTVKERGE